MKTFAITSILNHTLVVHEFDNEAEAMRTKPYIRRWERVVIGGEIRYHSTKAIRFWKSVQNKMKFNSRRFVYKNGSLIKTF